MPRWEYCLLYLSRDVTLEGWPTTALLLLPEDEVARDLGPTASPMVVLNQLGRDGWEVVGPPTDQNVVWSAPTTSRLAGPQIDRAVWASREFLLKRQVTE